MDIAILLPSPPPVGALDLPNRILLWSMREWLAAAISGKAVTANLRQGLDCLGMPQIGGAVAQFMDEAANAWPEQLRLYPSRCGCPISYDEWLLLSCIADAGRRDRCAFDQRLCEMIGRSTRDRLWFAAGRLARSAGHPCE
jgi:hypothetical protein